MTRCADGPRPAGLRAAALLLTALALACGGAEQQAEPTQETKPAPSQPAATPAKPVADAPTAPAGKRAAPDGASLYALYCASCHGARGEGDGPVAQSLDPRPARHSDATYMNGLSDAYLYRVIAEGGAAVGKSPLMAPWGGTLDDAQIRALVAFIRTLAAPTPKPD